MAECAYALDSDSKGFEVRVLQVNNPTHRPLTPYHNLLTPH